MAGKHTPLGNYLCDLPENQREVTLRVEEVERILHSRRLTSPTARWRHDAASGSKLPASAYEHERWRRREKEGNHVSARAWSNAGWKIGSLDVKEKWVNLIRGETARRGVYGIIKLKTLEAFMTKGSFRSLAIPLIVIPLGGLMVMVLTLVLYSVLYNLLESLFFPNDPFSFPAGALRRAFTIAMVLLYLLLLRSQLSDLLKAILLTGPLSAVVITVGHALYEQPAVSISAMVVTIAICGLLLYRFKMPWIYYYAGAIASLVALAYAWPRPQ